MEVPVSLESEIELFTTKEFDEAILLHNTSALVPVLKKALQTNEYQSVGLGKPIVPLKKDLLYLSAIAGGGQGLAGRSPRRFTPAKRTGKASSGRNSGGYVMEIFILF